MMATTDPMAGDPMTVVVPAACAGRLRDEAAGFLANAADNVAEGATWLRDGRDRHRLDDADRPRYQEADRLWPQAASPARDGGVSITASRSTVAALLRSCAQGAAEELRELADGPWSAQAMRGIAAELDGWADLFERADLSTAPDARAGA